MQAASPTLGAKMFDSDLALLSVSQAKTLRAAPSDRSEQNALCSDWLCAPAYPTFGECSLPTLLEGERLYPRAQAWARYDEGDRLLEIGLTDVGGHTAPANVEEERHDGK